MKLNKEQIRSVTESLKEKLGSELSDEMLEAISGGRDLRPIEQLMIMQYEKAGYFKNEDDIYEYVNAYQKYYDYISSLTDDSDTILFVLEEWK